MADRWIRVAAAPAGGGGGTTAYWETLWSAEKVRGAVHLLPALASALGDATRVLESGCGPAWFLDPLEAGGRTLVGVDLASRAVRQAHEREPGLRLAIADVGSLPFSAATFDAVLSLGVVEHDEDGPVHLLAEQRRVLRPGGRLVLTVPHRNWLRRATDLWHHTVRRRQEYPQGGRLVRRRRATAPDGRGDFHQYEFTPGQLRRRLHDAGFEISSWSGLDVGTGLRDLRTRPVAPTADDTSPAEAERARTGRGRAPRWLHAAVFGSEAVGPLGTAVRSLAGRALGHLQLVVATPSVDP